MFKGKSRYYHGTTEKRWESIDKDQMFKPSHKKFIGDYWITKGAYFVYENPYIALWYAHVAALSDSTEPIVISIEIENEATDQQAHLNLLTSEGHKLLAIAHTLYKEKYTREGAQEQFDYSVNLDSVALQMLFDNSTILKSITACFQEGKSYQNMIYQHKYSNKYIPEQKGFSPGDHLEICFYPSLEISEELNLEILKKEDILKEDIELCDFWPLVCESLTYPLENEEFKKRLTNALFK